MKRWISESYSHNIYVEYVEDAGNAKNVYDLEYFFKEE